MTSLQDVQILPDNLIKSLETMAGPYMGWLLRVYYRSKDMLNFLSDKFPVKIEKSFKKLSSFPDKESKVRVIGILDWYSK